MFKKKEIRCAQVPQLTSASSLTTLIIVRSTFQFTFLAINVHLSRIIQLKLKVNFSNPHSVTAKKKSLYQVDVHW